MFEVDVEVKVLDEIGVDKSKVTVTLEDGNQLIGYVLELGVRKKMMTFLQDGIIEPIQVPLDNVIRMEEIQESLQ